MRRTEEEIYEDDIPPLTPEQEASRAEALRIKEENFKRRNDELLKKQQELKREVEAQNSKSSPSKPKRSPPASAASSKPSEDPQDRPAHKAPPACLQQPDKSQKTPTSPTETSEEPPMDPNPPRENEAAMEPVPEETHADDAEKDKTDVEGPEEEEKPEEDPPVDPDHEPIKDDKDDDEDDDDPHPDGGGGKTSVPTEPASSSALGARAKSKPQNASPEHFDCVDDLDYDMDLPFEKVPSTHEEVVDMEVDDQEEEEAEVAEEVENKSPDEEHDDKSDAEKPAVNEFDPTDGLDPRRFDVKHVRSVVYKLDPRRVRENSEEVSFVTYKTLYLNIGERQCIGCAATCFSMCTRCGVYLCFSCRLIFMSINDPRSSCKCSSAYWSLSPNAYFPAAEFQSKLFVQDSYHCHDNIQLRDASYNLDTEFETLKTELANKFESLKGPFVEGENAGVLRRQNPKSGFPLRLPSVLDYEQGDLAGRPYDDDKFITPYSSEERINQLMDVMSRQLEGSVSQHNRDFVNAEQTQSESTTLTHGQLGT